jgi:hypothetical protein
MNIKAEDYIKAAAKLARSSGWKYQSQRFLLNRLTEISRLKKETQSGNYHPGTGSVFRINENGHERLVKSMVPRDAVFQHALCDSVIIPMVKERIIHDNGAGLKGRGLSFTRRRFEEHLRWHYRRYGREGYALIIDFSKYFDNIRHGIAAGQLKKILHDEELDRVVRRILKTYEVDISYTDDPNVENQVFNSLEYMNVQKKYLVGKRMMKKSLGIGAPVSQIIGILYPTPIDNYVKTVKAVRCYDAYMDDRIILHQSKDFLKALLKNIKEIAKKLGIHVNPRKTQIVKLSHGFTWLKTRYLITSTGKIIKKIPRDVTKRERRKLKRLGEKVRNGEMTIEDYTNQYRSWRGDKRKYNAFHTLTNMDLYARRQTENGRENKTETSQTAGNH